MMFFGEVIADLPLLLAEPDAGYPSCQTHLCNNNLYIEIKVIIRKGQKYIIERNRISC